MLDFLRKKKRNWSITILLGIIIVVFVAFYGGSKYGTSSVSDVVEVNGEPVTQGEFALQYEREVQRYRDMLKGSLTPEMIKGLNIKGNLVEALINKKLALQEARGLGLAVSDDDLANHLAKAPEFQIGGRFNKERYLQVLAVNRLLPAQFEEEQRDQLTIQRLYSVILDAVHVTDAEMRERYRIDQEKIDLNFIKLPISDFVSEVKPTDAEIKAFYERNKESLKEPLKIQVEYLSYHYDQFAAAAQVSDKEIDEYYKANLNMQFHTPKEVKARYISIAVEPGAVADQKRAAQLRAEAVVKEARAGKDFAQLAKKESGDPTAAKGGDVGWIAAGQMPPPVEKVLFSLAKGAVSDAIETPAGFQIFKVEDIKEEKTVTLKEATPEITKNLKTAKAKREAAKVADRDREKALSGADFNKLAQEGGATLKTTGWITNGQVAPEIGENQEFYKSAFSLSAKDVSPVVEGKGAYYLLRLKQRQEPAVPPLESVSAQIEKNLKESKAYELALRRGNSLLEQLKKEKDIGKLAQANNLKLDETGWFLRSAPQLPKIGELAEMKAGSIALTAQKPFPDRLYTQKDALYIIAFKDSQGADMEQFEKEKDDLKKQALAESRQRALIKFMEGLKSKAKIKVNTGFLEES
ncbi:MAG TPA: SurA N-terminal domain-containing protein [Candidatus Binatia bacterium]|nr:SurA N-terminal domain-containing protein [Candidatus Binatia bacterium]